MDFENMNIWCLLIPALTGIVCGIIGYYWGKGSEIPRDLTSDLTLLRDKNAKLQADLDDCNKRHTSGSTDYSDTFGAAPQSSTSRQSFNAPAAKNAMGKVIKQDDLKVIEGIGPKISAMFIAAGILSWKDLSETAVARCQEIVHSGGERYKVHDPASWPMQAKMCYEGKWTVLAKWQHEHKHGKL